MPQERAQRRLAAILAADVVGYSRLMQADEAGTLATLKLRRTEILQPLVGEHNGRVVKLMGDGVLVEFGSAVNAVECAVALQGAMACQSALPQQAPHSPAGLRRRESSWCACVRSIRGCLSPISRM